LTNDATAQLPWLG
jgi:hypothetical protein